MSHTKRRGVKGSVSFRIHYIAYNTLREIPWLQTVMNIKFNLAYIFIEVWIFLKVLMVHFNHFNKNNPAFTR